MRNWIIAITLAGVMPAFAQHVHRDDLRSGQGDGPAQSSYAGMEKREIKALSEQQIADLRAGKGMSLALPAELNGYPGPLHAMELAAQLGLTLQQQQQVSHLYQEMKAETIALGNELISREAELDRLFRDRKANPVSVQAAAAGAAQLQGRLRAAHLQYHLKLAQLLTPSQIERYWSLRGYR